MQCRSLRSYCRRQHSKLHAQLIPLLFEGIFEKHGLGYICLLRTHGWLVLLRQRMVTLLSPDKQSFQVPWDVAMRSTVVKQMLEGKFKSAPRFGTIL
jgi:hypothetical protein